MRTKLKGIICSIIVTMFVITSFAVEAKSQDISNIIYDEYASYVLVNTGEKNNDIKESNAIGNQKKPEDNQNTRGKVYVCKPFVLDHFGVIKDSLKEFGVSGEEVASYIREGKKLEEVLKLEKISVKSFKKEVIKQYNTRVKQGVKEGALTKEQAKKLKQAIKQTIKKWLD